MMGFSRYTVSINTKMAVIHSMQIRIALNSCKKRNADMEKD
ncbi:hypothetical protein HMPREF2738_01872 [Clostridiales bacterium KLE1615]|nr:hypothetical protein HMPREF2738_01872 [Clostridiales bacterium KLE1615]